MSCTSVASRLAGLDLDQVAPLPTAALDQCGLAPFRLTSFSMHADLVVGALGMAVSRRRPANGVIDHFDQPTILRVLL
jgi:hypothetical protein